MSLKRAVFFDRDGVVNRSPGEGYVLRVEDFHLMPGITEVLAWCKAQGFLIVLVTSQQGVGKGLMSQEDLDAIHASMQEELARSSAAFDGIYSCTDLAGQGTRRKPSPEMMFEAAADLGIDLATSAMVGDHDRDIQMGRNAGVAFTVRLAGEKEVSDSGDALACTVPEILVALKAWLTGSLLRRWNG
jgi:D-glycero-D-manno-heptose 1,7-bisphosphate phosphatase